MNKQLFDFKKTLGVLAGITMLSTSIDAEVAVLEKMDTQEFNEFYIASSIKIPTSRYVYVDQAEVSFSDTWLAEFRGETTRSYRRIIKKRYGNALKIELEKALEAEGWKISKEVNNETITLKPSLIDLNIFSPQTSPGRQTIILKNVGSTGVHIDFIMPSGDVLMRIIDADNTIEVVGSPLANRSYNYVYFKMLMTNWANMSAAYLESVVEEVEKQSDK